MVSDSFQLIESFPFFPAQAAVRRTRPRQRREAELRLKLIEAGVKVGAHGGRRVEMAIEWRRRGSLGSVKGGHGEKIWHHVH
jgi:hypothetical protein